MKHVLYIFLSLIFWLPNGLIAQDAAQDAYLNSTLEKKEFDETSWKNATEELDYLEKEKRPKERKSRSNLDRLPSSFFADLSWMKIVWYGLGVGLLGIFLFLIVRYVSTLQGGTKRQKRSFTLEEAEENLLETNLEQLLKNALTEGDYRLAIRIYYLQILQSLSLNNQIKWQRDKTNATYLREMRKQDSFQDFRHITRVFERTWYGDVGIDTQTFQQIRPQFEGYLKSLN